MFSLISVGDFIELYIIGERHLNFPKKEKEMSAYPPPTEIVSIFNEYFFEAPNQTISIADVANNYLRKNTSDIATGFITFNNSISVNGTFTYNGAAVDLSSITGVTPGIAAASKALVLDSSLNITGINNFTATGKITINSTVGGTVFSSIAGTSTIDLVHSLNGTALLGSTTSSAFGFRTAGVERARILTNGNFGIGTSTAAYKLDVNGTTNATSYYLSGALVDISSITGITNGTAAASKALILDSSLNIIGINNLSATSITVNGSAISTADLAYLSGITPGTAAASKALVVDASRNITNINSLTATTLVGTLTTAAQTSITSVGTLSALTISGTLSSGLHISTPGAETFTPGGGVNGTFTNNIRFTGGRAMGLYYDGIDLFYRWGGGGAYDIGAKFGQSGAAFCSVGNMAIGSMTINPTYKLEVTGSVNITANFLIAAENIGAKLTSITNGTALPSKVLVLDSSRNITNINSLTATTLVGTLSTAAQTAITSVGTLTNLTISGSLTMGATVLSAAELGVLDAVTPGTAAASKALVLDASSTISGINSISTTSLTLGGTVLSATELGYLTGITPGTAAANKALVCNVGSGVSGIGTLGCSQLNCANTNVTGAINIQFWNIEYGGGGTLDIRNDSAIATTYGAAKFRTGNVNNYNGYVLTGESYHSSAGSVKLGLWATNSNTAAQGKMWLQSDSSWGMSARSSFTGATSQADIFLTTAGVVRMGASGAAISNNHKLEIIGSVNISNSASAIANSSSPGVNVWDSTQSGLQGWHWFGRDLTNKCSWTIGSNYSSAGSTTNNYMYLKPGEAVPYGLIMDGKSNVAINGQNAGGTAVKPECPLHVIGYTSLTVPSGWGYKRTGSGSVVGGTVDVSLKTTHDVWTEGDYYATSDRRFKQNIEPIPEEEALKLLEVEPVFYQMKKKGNGREAGLIAQQLLDVELTQFVKIAQSSCKEYSEDFQYCVNYDRLTTYLIKLVQMQQNQINDLTNRVKLLETGITIEIREVEDLSSDRAIEDEKSTQPIKRQKRRNF